ncbi:MAG: YodL domain-containing protein [Oscillospiraceae bacterium]|nr:YodL domain-containing protein [Oscillospiraceae bacterium]
MIQIAKNESYAEQNRARLKEITDSIETGIRELYQSDRYRRYLITMSRFHRYSVNNQMLIYLQKPDATLCAGFHKWRDQFGRNVKKGEKGIKIIAPTPLKKKIEQEKLDPDTRLPILDRDGNVVMEEKTVQIPFYRVVTTFDVSQTEGKPLPELATTLTGDVQNYDVFWEALKRAAPVPIDFEPMRTNMDGYFSVENQHIAIRDGMSEVQTVSAAVHEIAHAKLHNYQNAQADAPCKSREQEELEAESISFAICACYGIDTSANSFGYLASWSRDKELSVLRASLETIHQTASALITDIDRNYRDICKERGLDKTAALSDTSEQKLDEYPMPDETLTAADLEQLGYTDGDLLPVSRERALALMEQDMTVYIIRKGESPEMAFDAADLDAHTGLFAVAREEWEASADFDRLVQDRLGHQAEREKAFLSYGGDCFAIYQVRRDDPQNVRFMNLDWLESKNLSVERDNYNLIYTAPLTGHGDTSAQLETLFTQFNRNRPADFHSPSMSVSDIVALRQDGVVSCHYCDSVGFRELPAFLQTENHLKNAEMMLEDDYNQLDGIINNGVKEPTVRELEEQARSGQPISLLELAQATHREARGRQEKRPSVMAKLREYQAQQEKTKTAPEKGAEMER